MIFLCINLSLSLSRCVCVYVCLTYAFCNNVLSNVLNMSFVPGNKAYLTCFPLHNLLVTLYSGYKVLQGHTTDFKHIFLLHAFWHEIVNKPDMHLWHAASVRSVYRHAMKCEYPSFHCSTGQVPWFRDYQTLTLWVPLHTKWCEQ